MNVTKMIDGAFRRQFEQGCTQLLREHAPTLADQFPAQIAELIEANCHRMIDEPAERNVSLCAIATAFYRLLRQQGLDRKSALLLLQDALIERGRKSNQRKMLWTLRLHPRPFNLIVNIGRAKQPSVYGKAFVFDNETDNMQTYYTSKITKCLYHDFFVAADVPEITPVFCAYDNLWGDLIADGRYGIKFTRPTTLGWGDDMCRFEFTRTQRGKVTA